MSKYIGPVCKLCRREGEKLYLKGERCFTPKCAIDRRDFAPGQHGRTGNRRGGNRSGRESDYLRQLQLVPSTIIPVSARHGDNRKQCHISLGCLHR